MGPPPPPSTRPEVSDKGTLSHPFYLLLWWKVLDVTSKMPFKTNNYEAIVKNGKGKGLGVCLLAFTEWLVYHGCEVIFNKGKAIL